MCRGWTLICFLAMSCWEKVRNQHASCERNKYSRRQLYCGENSLPRQALETQNGRRRTPCAQNGRAQIKGVSTTQASAISGMASSLRSSGAVEPPESTETCRGNGNRPTDFSRGRRQLRSLHFRFPNSQPQRCAHDKTKATWRSNPQRHLRLDQPHRPRRIEIFSHVHRRRNSDDISLCFKVKIGKGSAGMLPQIPQYLRTRWTTCQINSNGWRRRITEANGRIMQRTWDRPQGNHSLNSRTEWSCRTCKQDNMRKDTRNPRRNRSSQRTLGRTRMCSRPSQKSQPDKRSQQQDSLRGFVRSETRRISPHCHRHKGIRSYAQEEDQKVGSSQFRGSYGGVWWKQPISNLDSWDKQDQNISRCQVCRRSFKSSERKWTRRWTSSGRSRKSEGEGYLRHDRGIAPL